MSTAIERLESFCHGLGKAILREVAEDYAALQAEVGRLNGYVQKANHDVTESLAERDALRAELDALKGAEPVAYDDKGCTDMTPKSVMQRAFALCPTALPHMGRMAWIADYFMRNSAPQAPAPTKTEFTCWQIPDTDSWYEHPADAQIIHDLFGEDAKVGDEYELSASIFARTVRYRITSVSEDGDCEVEAAHGITGESQG